jgi:hypothetical protein
MKFSIKKVLAIFTLIIKENSSKIIYLEKAIVEKKDNPKPVLYTIS